MTQERKITWDEILRVLEAEGGSLPRTGRKLGLGPGELKKIDPRVSEVAKRMREERNLGMKEDFEAGTDLNELEQKHGMSRTRVKQILRIGGVNWEKARKARKTVKVDTDRRAWPKVKRAIRKAGGNLTQAAAALGMTAEQLKRRWPESSRYVKQGRHERNGMIVRRYEAGESVAVLAKEEGITRTRTSQIIVDGGGSKEKARRARKRAEKARDAGRWPEIRAIIVELEGNLAAVGRKIGMSVDQLKRRWPKARGVSVKVKRPAVPGGMLQKLLDARNRGESWFELTGKALVRGVPRWGSWNGTREAVVKYAKRTGQVVRRTCPHDPGRAARALALREQGLSWEEVKERSGYGSMGSVKVGVANARRTRELTEGATA